MRYTNQLKQSNYFTLVSSKSKKFAIQKYNYLSRQMKAAYLYNPIGITKRQHYWVATAERAVADMLYFNPRTHFDGLSLVNQEEKTLQIICKICAYLLKRKSHKQSLTKT